MFTKSLSQLIERALEKERKIEHEVNRVGEEIISIDSQIKQKRNNLIDLEFEGNTTEQKKVKNQIDKLKQNLAEAKERLEMYKKRLEEGCLTAREVKEIKNTAKGQLNDKRKVISGYRKEQEDIEKQIEVLEQKKNEINSKIFTSDRPDEVLSLKKIIRHIEPNYKNIKYRDYEGYLNYWLTDQNLERYFRE